MTLVLATAEKNINNAVVNKRVNASFIATLIFTKCCTNVYIIEFCFKKKT